jgi:hypothetical protein
MFLSDISRGSAGYQRTRSWPLLGEPKSNFPKSERGQASDVDKNDNGVER